MTHGELSQAACDGFRSFCSATARLTPDHPLMRPARDPEPVRVVRERSFTAGPLTFTWQVAEED